MTYSEILDHLNNGECATRSSWYENGECTKFICKQIPATIDSSKIVGMQSLPNSAKNVIQNWKLDNIKYINQVILVHRSGFITYYMPSSEDIFSNDWIDYV